MAMGGGPQNGRQCGRDRVASRLVSSPNPGLAFVDFVRPSVFDEERKTYLELGRKRVCLVLVG